MINGSLLDNRNTVDDAIQFLVDTQMYDLFSLSIEEND